MICDHSPYQVKVGFKNCNISTPSFSPIHLLNSSTSPYPIPTNSPDPQSILHILPSHTRWSRTIQESKNLTKKPQRTCPSKRKSRNELKNSSESAALLPHRPTTSCHVYLRITPSCFPPLLATCSWLGYSPHFCMLCQAGLE